jgi:uncharacterized RDD family membrane protein YckC
MRFPFPSAEPDTVTSAADAEPSLTQLHIPVAELAVATTTESKPGTCSVTVAAADSPELTAGPPAAEETPEFASESIAAAVEALAEATSASHLEAEAYPEATVRPRFRPKRKVIAFPHRPGATETLHRLADPVRPEQPRILEVPEELEAYPTTPYLDGLRFEPTTQASAVPADHVELPFRAVSIAQRIYAALVDCSLVAVAAVVFALICHKMLPDLAFTKPVRLTAALVPVLLWAIYQYLLLVYGGKTAGMQVAGIRLSTFKGRQPSLRRRRNRVLGLYLSTASLAMGLLWAFVDVDTLCWHDRLSGTYLTKRE